MFAALDTGAVILTCERGIVMGENQLGCDLQQNQVCLECAGASGSLDLVVLVV